jgi:hypothetical protein
MPFTFAHPAAAVPIAKANRHVFILSALVVGSMAPDFEYFMRLRFVTKWSHSLFGVFVFCLPVGLVILWLFHSVHKGPFVALLPDALQNTLLPWCRPFAFLPLRRFLAICLSLTIGAMTHILWDSFTHQNGFLVRNVSALRVTMLSVGNVQLLLYELLQDLSTALGLLLLAFWAWRAMAGGSQPESAIDMPTPGRKMKRRIVTGLLLASVLLAIIISLSMGHSLHFGSARAVVRHIIVVIIPSAYVVGTLYGASYRLVATRESSPFQKRTG